MPKRTLTCTVASAAFIACSWSTVTISVAGAARSADAAARPWEYTTLSVEGGVLSGVSCPATNSCVAVGYRGVSADDKPLVEVQGPNEWKAATTPVSAWGLLNSISCAGVGSCVAVGASGTNADRSPYSLVLTGTHWTAIRVPWPGPKAGSGSLSDVSCQTAHSCIAVGVADSTSSRPSTQVFRQMAYYFDGKRWVPLKLLATLALTVLTHISCDGGGNEECTAVGVSWSSALQMADQPGAPVVVRLAGRSWMSVAVRHAHTDGTLYGVWCAQDKCIAVGAGTVGSGQPLVLTGNSKVWAETPAPQGPGLGALVSVSCMGTVSTCVAVGENPLGTVGYVLDWHGSWHRQPTGLPSSGVRIAGATCARSRRGNAECTVVGSRLRSGRLSRPFVVQGPLVLASGPSVS
jgi:hypothetical protein